ncbi:hypothetical protein PENSPDRAFT_742231 [Peniophora sp. CONT]|nr:hypothetical protein PENSPDRAFT_742231 [Peniophora sp. CONT]
MEKDDAFWFPDLSDAEIMDALDAWGIRVTPKLLAKPTEDFTKLVYGKCLEMVFGITSEMLEEAVDASLIGIHSENMDSCRAGALMTFIVYHMARFASAAKISDFSSKDVAVPDTKRTRNIISAFVNFVNFYEQNAPIAKDLQERSGQFVQERDRIISEGDRIRSELASIEAKRAQDEPQMEVLRIENQTLTANVKVQQGYFDRSQTDMDKLKAEKALHVQDKESLYQDMSLVSDALSRLRARVVKSPERIKRNISLMGGSQAEERRTLASMEDKIRDLQAKANALLAIEKDIRDCVEQVLVLRKDIETLDLNMHDLDETKMALDARRNVRTELELRQERAQRQFEYAVASLEKVQRDIQEHRSSGQQQIERLQREYEHMAAARHENDQEVEELRQKAKAVELRAAEHLKQSNVTFNRLLAAYRQVRAQNEVYMETLSNKLGIKKTSKR